MPIQRAASTKAQAQQMKSGFLKQGYKGSRIIPNPPKSVGKRGIKKYTVHSGWKSRTKKGK